jgi:GTP-binding protein Era
MLGFDRKKWSFSKLGCPQQITFIHRKSGVIHKYGYMLRAVLEDIVTRKGQFSEFVGRWKQEIQSLWDDLPKDVRADMDRVIRELPIQRKEWRALIERASEHLRLLTGQQHMVAIVGPANVGKSTLYNQIILEPQDRAAVSAVPGTTRESQAADVGIFTLIDTPGADAVGAVGEEERLKALDAAGKADVILLMFDASHGIRSPEQELFQALNDLDKPMIVALNKMDLVKGERARVIGKAAADLGIETDQIVPLLAIKGQGIERVLTAVAKSEPGIVAALGAALPAYRWDLAQVIIGRSASTAAAIAITPLPFLDFIPLVGVQAAMVLGIARIYKQKMTLARARELILTFGLGFLGRTLFYELSKLGGPPGWLVAAAVAAGMTVAIGYAVMIWFERGVKLTNESLKRISSIVGEVLVERLRALGGRRPSRGKLQDRVRQALEEIDDEGVIEFPDAQEQ